MTDADRAKLVEVMARELFVCSTLPWDEMGAANQDLRLDAAAKAIAAAERAGFKIKEPSS